MQGYVPTRTMGSNELGDTFVGQPLAVASCKGSVQSILPDFGAISASAASQSVQPGAQPVI
ncbi:MAG: hypothetical protein WAO98_11235 [Alphaproteobacteria bacterium]